MPLLLALCALTGCLHSTHLLVPLVRNASSTPITTQRKTSHKSSSGTVLLAACSVGTQRSLGASSDLGTVFHF